MIGMRIEKKKTIDLTKVTFIIYCWLFDNGVNVKSRPFTTMKAIRAINIILIQNILSIIHIVYFKFHTTAFHE